VRTESAGLSPFDYVRPVWRFKWLVLILVVAAAAAAYEYYKHKPTKYEAGTQVYVGASPLSNLLNGGSVVVSSATLAEDAQLVTTPQVARRVIDDLKLNTTSDVVLSGVSVVPDATSESLGIDVVASQPQLAITLVNAFARAYLEESAAAEQADAQSAIAGIKRQLARANGSTRTALTNSLAELEAAAALPAQVGQQLSPALGAAPTKANPVRDAVFAGALAFLLGLVACYMFDRSDTRLRRLDDIEGLLGLPILASIPRVRRADAVGGSAAEPVADLREPYRTLRVNLDMVRAKEGVRTIMVTSALPSEGKTTAVRNLALAYREAGLSVAIIEADMRRPVLGKLFGVSSDRGLSDILESGDKVDTALVTVAGAGTAARLDLVLAGRPPENPTALLRPEAFRAVRNQLLADHALVLVDSPPVLAVSDALAIAGQVDGVLLVVRAAVSTGATVKRLRQTFEQIADVTLLGTVANAVTDNLGVESYMYHYSHEATAPRSAARAASNTNGDIYGPLVDDSLETPASSES
jgi:capsular exopolysaccharide synthesis family protein